MTGERPVILMPGPMMESVTAALDARFRVVKPWETTDPDAAVAAAAPVARGIATAHAVDGALMRRMPRLEIIASFGVGYDHIDVAAARELGIRVTNTPDVLNDAVAELTVGLMVALCRRLPQGDAFVRSGRWERESFPLTRELGGAVAGILGLGRIGKEIARRLVAMKMTVVYHGRAEQPDQPYRFFADLEAMARAVDWLVVAAPGGEATRGIVGRSVLEALGAEGCLVNVARGSLVDEAALVELLSDGRLGGAALDVFADEPRVPAALRTLEPVVLAPHVGSATHRTRRAMGDMVVRNLIAHFDGEPLLSPVN